MSNLSCIPKFVKEETIDIWVAETWMLMLLSSKHIPNAGTQQYVSDVVANEIAASAPYFTGGIAIEGKVAVAHGYNYYIDATDVVIGPTASLTYRYGILFQYTGNLATSKIRAQIDFYNPLRTDGNQVVIKGTSTIRWNALGIIYIS